MIIYAIFGRPASKYDQFYVKKPISSFVTPLWIPRTIVQKIVNQSHIFDAPRHYYEVLCFLQSFGLPILAFRHRLGVFSSNYLTNMSMSLSSFICASNILTTLVHFSSTGSTNDANVSGIAEYIIGFPANILASGHHNCSQAATSQ